MAAPRHAEAEGKMFRQDEFVRKVDGVNVDLNGQPASVEDDEEDREWRQEEEPISLDFWSKYLDINFNSLPNLS
ncbi:UNVERIFIED_CONTAM: hypothetical protein Sindi_0792600 [Sesamum indicum]